MADGLTAESVIYTCEFDPKAVRLARDLFKNHGYLEQDGKRQKAKIELLEGDGLASLDVLAKNGHQFDAIFIDADKPNYVNYFDFIMDNNLLSRHGYILADNVVFSGLVLNAPGVRQNIDDVPKGTPPLLPQGSDLVLGEDWSKRETWQNAANHIHRFNEHVANDSRVEVACLPLFDGLSVIMHKNA
ncbi:hypothetical protein BGZ83_002737 [Gryganskiella cystojenkinii]|nr:hypothetical protein BGZ83_002737 [Gryganskiella cystojenkinii]